MQRYRDQREHLPTDVVKQLTEAAGTEDLTIIVQVKNANGDVKYTVSVSAKNVKNNKSLKAFDCQPVRRVNMN